jgi:hypothetical protein
MIFYGEYSDVPKEIIERFITDQQLGRLVTVSDSGQPHIGLYPFLFLVSTIEMPFSRPWIMKHPIEVLTGTSAERYRKILMTQKRATL